jgi:hypothetical protein
MDKSPLQQALDTIEEEIKKLKEASEVIKSLLQREGIKIPRKGRVKGSTYSDFVVETLKQSNEPLTAPQIAERITASGKRQATTTAIRIVLNREKGKLFKKTGKRQWTLIQKE